MKTNDVRVELPDAEADALAQLVKRICWAEVRANAFDSDEAEMMIQALHKLRKGLAEAGFNPR